MHSSSHLTAVPSFHPVRTAPSVSGTWNSGNERHSLGGHKGPVWSVAVSPDGSPRVWRSRPFCQTPTVDPSGADGARFPKRFRVVAMKSAPCLHRRRYLKPISPSDRLK